MNTLLTVLAAFALPLTLFFAYRALVRRRALQRLRDLETSGLPPHHAEFLKDFHPYQFLTPTEKKRFNAKFLFFLEDKAFHGVDGLEVTDYMKQVVAAEACLMITNLPGGVFPGLRNIYLTQDDFVPKHNPVDEHTGLPQYEERSGEAWQAGPLIFSWRAIEDGESVIYHEFSHHLDQQEDGGFDGTPELGSEGSYDEWARVMGEEFLGLREAVAAGKHSYIDDYAATSEAEFFAVVTEYFFTEPRDLLENHPELFRVFQNYYRLDPLLWDP